MPVSIEILSLKTCEKGLPPRSKDSHKGDFGHVLIVGGEVGYSGAVRLAGEAALRVGTGLVSIVTRKEHALFLQMNRPELMCHSASDEKQLKKLMQKATVIILGPGLGHSTWSTNLWKKVVKNRDKPMVVDADGLNLLAGKKFKNDHWILTPHPGEASRLLNKPIEWIQQNRVEAAIEITKIYGGVCVLKGFHSLIAQAENYAQCDAGNPGMATAGMGDVLSGVIGGCLAQGLGLMDAAKLGVVVHATAGDLAGAEGQRGMIASDLFPYLRKIVNT